MVTFEEKVGTNAGYVWTYLSESGKKSLKEVKKVCKLTDKDLYAALGWLAREGKIQLTESKEDIIIELI